MDIFFNELSIEILAQSKKDAYDWMQGFFSTIMTFSKRIHKFIYVRSSLQFKIILIHEQFSFSEWLESIKDQEFKRAIIATLTGKPILQKYPYYRYNDKECIGFGYAFEENSFSISYPFEKWEIKIKILKEFISNNEIYKQKECFISNLSKPEDVYNFFPLREFEHHKKHDNRRPRTDDGESTLEYNIPENSHKVQKLLDLAIPDSGRKLYYFDKEIKKYIEFNQHLLNKFHGYHITDVNRVPNDVAKKISESINL